MFETLKRILLNEILEEVQYADEISEEISKLEKEYDDLEIPKYISLFEPSDPKQTYSLFRKIIDYRYYNKKKKEYVIEKEEYEKLKLLKEQNENDYIMKKNQLEKKLFELKKIWEENKLEDIQKKYMVIKDSTNIKELGYTINEVIKLFNEKGIPLVLDSTDQLIENESNFDKLEDLVLVHKTMYAPSGDEIKTTSNSKSYYEEEIDIGSEKVDIKFQVMRDTVHFAINGEVGDHYYGSWEDCKYAIVIPFVDVPNIINAATGDTYTKGNVDIKKGFLLCPFDEMEHLKKNNPNITIIGYKGDNVTGFANIFVSMLGYKYERICMHGWENEDAKKVYNTIKSKTNYKQSEHSVSNDKKEEEAFNGTSQLSALIEKLLKNKVNYDLKNIISKLLFIERGNRSQLRISDEMFRLYDGKIFIRYIEDLKKYDIFIPNYILDIYNAEKIHNINIDEIKSIPDDAKNFLYEFIRHLEKINNHKYEFDYTEKVLIYEILKQVKDINEKKLTEKEVIKKI